MDTDRPEQAPEEVPWQPDKPEKMQRLPDGTKIHRRPSVRRPSSNNSSKTIYVSTRTSFMSVVQRVRKQLDAGSTPATGSTKGLPLSARIASLRVQNPAAPPGKEVLVKGTGRAIEKTLNVAAWFNKRREYKIALRTQTVAVVDDLILEEDGEQEGVEESRVRMVSCLEVGVRLR